MYLCAKSHHDITTIVAACFASLPHRRATCTRYCTNTHLTKTWNTRNRQFLFDSNPQNKARPNTNATPELGIARYSFHSTISVTRAGYEKVLPLLTHPFCEVKNASWKSLSLRCANYFFGAQVSSRKRLE